MSHHLTNLTSKNQMEGKAIASGNATKHGILTSKVFVQEGLQEEFFKMRDGFYLEFQPKGDLETFLLERVISGSEVEEKRQ